MVINIVKRKAGLEINIKIEERNKELYIYLMIKMIKSFDQFQPLFIKPHSRREPLVMQALLTRLEHLTAKDIIFTIPVQTIFITMRVLTGYILI